MTATFGKLEHQTLTLEPGLNVIEAPNEWGKSTWCAFLINMLYGVDTRARANGTQLPDKERYAPWSGAPMSGKISLNWNGRDITIERTSNARTPMGIFKAYETESGLDVPELNANNCGQMLLGVERSVFAKAGFLRLADLPVVQDDVLRRRLNSLVTTGDESGTADKLAQMLKDLKNKCRSNRANGLIPEAEEQREQLRKQLYDMQDLGARTEQIKKRQQELEGQLHALEVHKQALDYADAQTDAQRVAQAEALAEDAQVRLQKLQEQTQALPAVEALRSTLATANTLQQQQLDMLARQQGLPQKPQQPEAPACFADVEPSDAVAKAKDDVQLLQKLTAGQKKYNRLIAGFSVFAIAAAATLSVLMFVLRLISVFVFSAGVSAAVSASFAVIIISAVQKKRLSAKKSELAERYKGQVPDSWIALAEQYEKEQADYQQMLFDYQRQTDDILQRQAELNAQIAEFSGDKALADRRENAENALALWSKFYDAQKDASHAVQRAQDLRALVKEILPPEEPDTLLYSYQHTKELLASAQFEQQQLQIKLAQCQGQMAAQGQEPAIRSQIKGLTQRIERLEEYYNAIEMAQAALQKASVDLQRRFAPRISQRAQELFGKLTSGRYRKITMAADLSLSTVAEDEDTLREAQRRSDGTVDQLYLALRLAVAEELTPQAPLVLDDALVRFDDVRLKSAMEILKEASQMKQVIVFTCQSREKTV